jgi:cardiolipin synthase
MGGVPRSAMQTPPKKPLAAILGAINWPTRITMLRILLVPLFVMAMMQVPEDPRWRFAALGIMIASGLSDVADGVLARRMGLKTRLGAFLDPLADKILMTTGYILCAALSTEDWYFPSWLAVLVVSRDLLICIGFFVIHFIKGTFRFEPNRTGKAATVLMVLTLAAHLGSPWPPVPRIVFDVLVWATAAITVASGSLYARSGLGQLAEHEEAV